MTAPGKKPLVTSLPTTIQGVSSSKAGITLLSVITVYVLLFFYLAHLKYMYCTNLSADTAIFNHAFWSSFHGKFFYVYPLQMSWFGDKSGWLLPLLLPLYGLVPGVHTLLFASCCIIGLSAIPVYLLAVDVLKDRTAALLSTGAYLLFPTIVSQTVNQVGMLQYVVALVALALFFSCRGRYLPFLVSCFLALVLGTEDVGLTVAMFLPYALIKRRGLKWGMPPVVMAAAWYVLTFTIIMPAFRGDHPYRALGYLSNLGNTPGEIVHSLLLDPRKIIDSLLTPANFWYLLLLLQPLLWISPWVSWEVLFVLPYLSLNLLAQNSSMKNIVAHYNVTVGMFLCIAVLFTIRRCADALTSKLGQARYECGFAILFLCLAIVSWPLWLNISNFRPRPYYAAQVAAMRAVPPDKSVVAPETMVAHFSSRERFHTLQGIVRWGGDLASYDYIVLDLNDRFNDPLATPELANQLATNPQYESILQRENVRVFHRR